MSDRIMSLSAGTQANVTLFPNGAPFSTTDVFLGALLLKWIEFHIDNTTQLRGVMNIYEAIVNSTGQNVRGGTTGTALVDQFRVIAGGTPAVVQTGEPYTFTAPNAEVTNLRKIVDTVRLERASSSDNQLRMEFGDRFMLGCAIHLTNTTATNLTVNVCYTPLTSGYSRRRLLYGRGTGTTKQLPVAHPTV